MFKTRDALWERIVREKERQIDILAEQVEYLRMQLAMQAKGLPLPVAPVLKAKTEPLSEVEVQPYVSDEELDARAMLEAGDITAAQLPDVLEALGLAGDLTIDIPPLN